MPLVVLAGLMLFRGLSLGIDYSSSNVIQFELTENLPIDEVEDKLKQYEDFSRLEMMGESEYRVYYQNVNLERLESLQTELEKDLGKLTNFQVLVYNPTTLVLITGRIFYGIYAGVVIYLIYLAYLLRGKGLSREKLIWLLLADFLIVSSIGFLVAGLLNSVDIFDISISATTISFGLGVLLYAIFLNLLLSVRFSIKGAASITQSWKDSVTNFRRQQLKYYVLTGCCLIALVLFDQKYSPLAFVLVVTLAYSLFLSFKLKPVLIDWLLSGSKQFKPFAKSRFLAKKW